MTLQGAPQDQRGGVWRTGKQSAAESKHKNPQKPGCLSAAPRGVVPRRQGRRPACGRRRRPFEGVDGAERAPLHACLCQGHCKPSQETQQSPQPPRGGERPPRREMRGANAAVPAGARACRAKQSVCSKNRNRQLRSLLIRAAAIAPCCAATNQCGRRQQAQGRGSSRGRRLLRNKEACPGAVRKPKCAAFKPRHCRRPPAPAPPTARPRRRAAPASLTRCCTRGGRRRGQPQ